MQLILTFFVFFFFFFFFFFLPPATSLVHLPPQEVSDLRLKSSSYCQEVSDLQEVLQWKEKKMAV